MGRRLSIVIAVCAAVLGLQAAAVAVARPAGHGVAPPAAVSAQPRPCIGPRDANGGVAARGASRSRSEAAPMRRLGGRPRPRGEAFGGTASSSSNWAGYDVFGASYTSVTATWVQPAVRADASVEAHSCFWVGLDGDGSPTVEQCGTTAVDRHGSVAYYAWYEIFPAPETIITGVTVSPGDTITATAASLGSGNFAMTVADTTAGWKNVHYGTCSSAQLYSAEVIAEAPTDATTNAIFPLADFGKVQFTNCAINGQAISAFDLDEIDMVAADGHTALATPSALGADGASFSVSTPTGAPVDTTPPTTTVSGADDLWHRAPVTLTFDPSDEPNGSGVAYTEYSLDSGATWTRGTFVTIPAPADHSGDGVHAVWYRSADYAGNIETYHTCEVSIDTLGPACAAQDASVRHGRSCRLYFKVYDLLSPQVTTVLQITTRSGVVLKQWSWDYDKNTSDWWWTKYTCGLPRGTYLLQVLGKDLAGNDQSVVGQATLRVR